MSWISLDYQCKKCEKRTWATVERAVKDTYLPICTACQIEMIRIPSSPLVLRASYPDGTRRFSDLKEAANIEVEMMDMPEGDRQKARKEIKKMGVDSDI